MWQRAARCGEMITVENGEIWCGEIDSTLVRMVGAEGKGPIRGPWTYAPISKGSAVRSADHDRQTPRRPRISGLLVVSLSRTQRALSHCGHTPKCISHPQPRSVAPGSSQLPASRAIESCSINTHKQ